MKRLIARLLFPGRAEAPPPPALPLDVQIARAKLSVEHRLLPQIGALRLVLMRASATSEHETTCPKSVIWRGLAGPCNCWHIKAERILALTEHPTPEKEL